MEEHDNLLDMEEKVANTTEAENLRCIEVLQMAQKNYESGAMKDFIIVGTLKSGGWALTHSHGIKYEDIKGTLDICDAILEKAETKEHLERCPECFTLKERLKDIMDQ